MIFNASVSDHSPRATAGLSVLGAAGPGRAAFLRLDQALRAHLAAAKAAAVPVPQLLPAGAPGAAHRRAAARLALDERLVSGLHTMT